MKKLKDCQMLDTVFSTVYGEGRIRDTDAGLECPILVYFEDIDLFQTYNLSGSCLGCHRFPTLFAEKPEWFPYQHQKFSQEVQEEIDASIEYHLETERLLKEGEMKELKDCKLGDDVFSTVWGSGLVSSIDTSEKSKLVYPLYIEFKKAHMHFTVEGRNSESEEFPTLFAEKPFWFPCPKQRKYKVLYRSPSGNKLVISESYYLNGEHFLDAVPTGEFIKLLEDDQDFEE